MAITTDSMRAKIHVKPREGRIQIITSLSPQYKKTVAYPNKSSARTSPNPYKDHTKSLREGEIEMTARKSTKELGLMLEDLALLRSEEPSLSQWLDKAKVLLIKTYSVLKFSLPYGSPGIMEDGAVRIDWRHKDKDVSLVLQGDSAVPSYIHIYMATTHSSSIVDNISVFNLSHKLEWLLQ